MLFHSFIGSLTLGLLYHVVLVASQAALNAITQAPTFVQSAAPELAGSGTSSQPCGGCYLVADVAGLVWYSEIFLNTAATELVSVGVGNGTRATRTSVLQNEGAFTFNPAATAAGSNALTQVAFDPTVSISGAILQSPTAYNVFTAYSVTSAYLSNGLCVTTSGSKIELTSAYSEILPTASGKVYLDANGQQDFIDHLGFHSCSGGGENIVPTALIQVMNTTATQVTTFSGILAAQSASLTIAPQSSSSPSSRPAGNTTSNVPSNITSSMNFPSAGVPLIVIGNQTITPTPNPIGLPVYNGTVISSASSIILSTGGNGNLITGYPGAPYIGAGNNLAAVDVWLLAWTAGAVGLGAGVYYL